MDIPDLQGPQGHEDRAGADLPRTTIGEEEDSHLGDFIEDKNAVSPVDAMIDVTRQIEAKALRKLRHPSRSRKLKAFLEGSIV